MIRRVLISDQETGAALVDCPLAGWEDTKLHSGGVCSFIKVLFSFSGEIKGGEIQRVIFENPSTSPHFFVAPTRPQTPGSRSTHYGTTGGNVKIPSTGHLLTDESDVQSTLSSASSSSQPQNQQQQQQQQQSQNQQQQQQQTLCLVCDRCDEVLVGSFIDSSDEAKCQRAKEFCRSVGQTFTRINAAKHSEMKPICRQILKGIDEEKHERTLMDTFRTFSQQIESNLQLMYNNNNITSSS